MSIDINIDTDDVEEETLCDNCGDLEEECDCVHCYCGSKCLIYDACSVCGEAHPGCCECCGNCGCVECECCQECGEAGCECGEGFGDSDRTPWEQRGVSTDSTANNSTSNWQMIWPEIDATNFDLCREAADFYLLEAITNGIVNSDNPFLLTAEVKATPEQLLILIGADDERVTAQLETRRLNIATDESDKLPSPLEIALRGVIKEAKNLFAQRIERSDEIFRAYFHMAVAGEARHHRAIKNRILSGDRDRAWSGWRSIYDQVGPEALLDLANLFMEFTGGTYGGAPWAEACKILYSREMGTLGPNEFLNKKMFVDRAWTLEHNGGCFLNKISWAVKNPNGWHIGELKSKILDSHASSPPNWRSLLRAASEEVLILWDQIWEINNELNGTTNENPRNAQPQRRIICRHCDSNPLKGHFKGCAAHMQPNFNKGKINENEYSSWYMVLEEDDWASWNWHRWDTTDKNAFFTPDFKLKDTTVPIELDIRPTISVYIELKSDPTCRLNSTFYTHIPLKISQDEALDFEIDALNVFNGFKDPAIANALKEFGILYHHHLGKKTIKKDEVRITFTQGNILYSSPFSPSNSHFVVIDPLKPQAPKKFKPLEMMGELV